MSIWPGEVWKTICSPVSIFATFSLDIGIMHTIGVLKLRTLLEHVVRLGCHCQCVYDITMDNKKSKQFLEILLLAFRN